uniref:uncharacterized protein LOC120327876 n=1 Tax=Styela clava TaxID=7725 RepID=UPI00193ADF90|nr:uncharacterized protein LOC120327876 [Styela clava]
MDALYLPIVYSYKLRYTVSGLLAVLFALTSIQNSSALPQKLSEYSNKNNGRWKIDNCFVEDRNYDVTFVIDAATSQENLRNIQRFINDVTRRLNLPKSRGKIGFITYGVRVKTLRLKKRWRHHAELRDAVNALKPVASSRRNAGKALLSLSQTVNAKSTSRSFIILLIGGQSMDPVVRPGRILQRKHARIIAIGYNRANATQLRPAVSRPVKDNLIMLDWGDDLIMATDTILSIICEEVLNRRNPMQSKFPLKKQAVKGKSTNLLGPSSVISSPESIQLKWNGNSSPLLLKYRIAWAPRDGSLDVTVKGNFSIATLTGLNPATIYKIKVSPLAKRTYGRPLTIIAATVPLPVANLTAKIEYVEPCTLQKQLQRLFKVKQGIVLKPSDCEKSKAVLFVGWQKTSKSKFYMMSSEPKAARLVRLTKRSTKQFLTNVKPGVEYKLSVITRGPKLHESSPESVSVVIPPMDPVRLDTVVVNSTTVAVRWQMPKLAIYDSFLISVISAFGKTSYGVGVEAVKAASVNQDIDRPFYTSLISNLRPDTEYKLTVYAQSKNIPSRGNKMNEFSTKISSDLYNEPFLILSGGDGIYAATATRGPGGTESVQRLFPVVGGVVNSVYHSRWIQKDEDYFSEQGSSFQWQKLLIWIERYTRDIKVTDLTSQSRTVTLVSGLLQPVGLIIDPYGETIYWSDVGSQSIGVASISNEPGSRPYQVNRNLISGDMQAPVSLAIDVVDRYLFWGDLQGQIERSDMAGLHRTVLLKRQNLLPYSMTFCSESKMLYWIDASTGNLEVMSSTGENYKIIDSSAMNSMLTSSTLVIADRSFYWFENEINSIMTLKKYNESEEYDSVSSLYSDIKVPSVTAMNSFDPASLEQGFGNGYTSMEWLVSLMKESTNLSFPCYMSETFCIGVCIPVTMDEAICSNDCKPWETMCYRSKKVTCIDKHLTCNGITDCEFGEDEDLPECEIQIDKDDCESANMSAYGCHDSGKCVSYEVVCDGRIDCKDGSDEKKCPIQKQMCDFENDDFCLWTQETQHDDFDWVLHNRKTPSNDTGPLMDHSMLTLNGSYIYLEATPQNEGDKAQLISVYFAKPICISLYYYMHGHTSGQVSVFLREYETGNRKLIWKKIGEQGAVWNNAVISVDSHQIYQIIMEGTRGEDYRSDIALDDITISDGLCTVTTECDFHNLDDSMCGYKLGNHWKQVSGEDVQPDSKPQLFNRKKPLTQDLSKALGSEWFYFDFKYDDFPGCSECNGARLVRDISSLEYAEDGIKYAGVVLCDKTRYKIYLSESLSGPFRNIADGAGKGEDHCEFIGGSDYAKEIGAYKECEGDVGYVRRRWGEKLQTEAYGFYRSIYFAASSYKCGFEFPDFVVKNDPKKWLESLPNSYLYMDASTMVSQENAYSDTIVIPLSLKSETTKRTDETQKIVEEAEKEETEEPSVFVLSSKKQPKLNQTKIVSRHSHPTSWCLKFRYFIVGPDIESFQVSINNEYIIWVKNEEQGKTWKNASVDLPYPNIKYDLIITAKRGDGYNGSIGIDDVTISHESCHPEMSYRCTFDVPVNEDCAFQILGDSFEQVSLDSLYKRLWSDPKIVQSHDYSSGVITGKEVELSNGTTVTSGPYLRSPVLPRLSNFYPVLCLTVNYRQRSDEGLMSVIIRSTSSGQFHTLSSHHLPAKKSIIRPWLTYIAQIDKNVPIVSEENFYIEFRGLNATWINELTLDTVECPAVVEDLCSNSIRCTNGDCVSPESLCDGINDCGDWSDEVGCSSKCGNIADYFDVKAFFDGTNSLEEDTCTHRIHGQPGKQTLLTVGAVQPTSISSHIVMKVYEGFKQRQKGGSVSSSGYFPAKSLVFQTDRFSEKTTYLIESHDVTIVMEYSNLSMSPVPLSYEMVEDGHCSLVCPDHHCLFNNRYCDGILGCSDGSDERNCTRLVIEDGVKVLEVRHLDGPFAPICADDITEQLADAVCKQLNDLHAERPLNKTGLPASYNKINPHKLVSKYEITESTLIQALVTRVKNDKIVGNASFPVTPKKTVGACKSRETWIPNCISYQCGVRPIDVNPSASKPGPNPILRIIGGGSVRKAKWPWMASLLLKERDHNCGATLISDRFVITAAHCFDEHKPQSFTVLLGANSIKNHGKEASKHAVKRGIIHRSYNKQADIPDWDLALVELDPPAHFSTYVSPICLPQGDMEFPPGTQCFIAGFGHISEGRGSQNMLNDAKTPIISNSECDTDMYRGSITERMLCSGFPTKGGVGICHGDSGGPLMCQHQNKGSWYQVGVISWSIGCANKGKPDVFTKLLSHVEWINEQTGFNLSLPSQNRPVVGTCGGTYYGSNTGTFASPGWPKKYWNDQECTYTILADLGQTIHLSFDEFETELYFDNVEVFSGDMSVASRVLSQLSGTKRPDPLGIRSSAVYVYFKSDDDTSEKGFVASWRVSGKPTPYEGPGHPIEVRLRSVYSSKIATMVYKNLGIFFYGGIGPGGWPYYLQYPSRMVKHRLAYIPQIGQWVIRPDRPLMRSNENIGLKTTCVSPTPDQCGTSWKLWNGTKWINIQLVLDVKIGMKNPQPTVSVPVSTATDHPSNIPDIPTTSEPNRNQEAELEGQSDESCGGLLTDQNGTISSPGYGEYNYSNNLNCKWFINPSGSRNSTNKKSQWILLEFVDMDTQQLFDYVKGFPGNNTSAIPLFGMSGKDVHLEDDSENELEISPIDPDLETRDEVEPYLGLFGNFGFAFGTPAIVNTPKQTTTTTPVQTRGSNALTATMKPITTVLKYEDTEFQGLTLTFTTDDEITSKGFFLRYYVIDDITKSPLDSDDYVTIDIFEDKGTKGGRRKRSVVPDFSYFYTSVSGDYEGSGEYYEYDYYDYTALKDVKPDASCNFTLTMSSAATQIISYETPDNGSKDHVVRNCLWRLKIDFPLQLVDLEINLGSYSGPIISYLFQVGNDHEHDILRVDLAPQTVLSKKVSSLGEVMVHFKTDGKQVGFNITATLRNLSTPPGFIPTTIFDLGKITSRTPTLATTIKTFVDHEQEQTVQITSTCSNVTGIIEENQYFIHSPNHPQSYLGNTECTWVLKAAVGQQISITFTKIGIEKVSSDCSYDNVTVYNGEIDAEPVGVFCGKDLPEQIISTGSVMVIKFTTDRLIHDIGFRAVISALETIKYSPKKPMSNSLLFSCNFDNEDICGFTHDKSEDVEFTWTKQFSTTPSENTGPPHDASESKDGNYMFIEASMPRVPGDRARIVSPVIEAKPSVPMCLNFAYSMRGLSVGSLVVYISIASDGAMMLSEQKMDVEMQIENMFDLRPIVLNFGAGLNQERMVPTYRNSSGKPTWQQYVLWSKTSEQDDEPWLKGEVTFTPNNHFQLLFEGIRGSEYQSDIAIDSIVVRQGECKKKQCSKNELQCVGDSESRRSVVCVSKELECDGHNDCLDGSDEASCTSPLRDLCDRMSKIPQNTTQFMICDNVERCSPKSVNIGHVKDIACDGTYDCFGGYDESHCDVINKQKVSLETETKKFGCGVLSVNHEDVTERSKIHNIPPETMPWVAGLYIQVHKSDMIQDSITLNDPEKRFLFLCSAVFIRESWLLAPAHCILDPEMTKQDLKHFLHNRESSNTDGEEDEEEEEEVDYEKLITEPLNQFMRYDDPFLSELNNLDEFQDMYPDDIYNDDVIDQTETVFEYYVILPAKTTESKPTVHRVSKLVPHPEYSMMKLQQDCNSTTNYEVKMSDEKFTSDTPNESINCDINRIQNDVTLIRIEDVVTFSTDEVDVKETEERTTQSACLNSKQSQITATNENIFNNTSTELNNMFQPPSEKLTYSKSFKSKATCYAVGFSFPHNDDVKKSELQLSRKSVQLATGDVSAEKLICGMQNLLGPTEDCLDLIKMEQNFSPLLVGGYNGVKDAAFMYDQGPVLMCKSWNDRWYLTGIYSWSNLYRNLQHDRLYEVTDEAQISGGILQNNMILGIPSGVDLFLDVTQISDWVQETLREDCPGEFPCYDASMMIDCPFNYLDEINCASGCSYDETADPMGQYYKNLNNVGVQLPENIIMKYNLNGLNHSMSGKLVEIGDKNPKSIIIDQQDDIGILFNATDIGESQKSWRNGLQPGNIRANVVNKQKLKMCIWTIKAPPGKVSVLHVHEFNAIPGGNKIQIINSGFEQSELLQPNMKDVYYTSRPGDTLTIRMLPPSGQPYLEEIRYFEASHHAEGVGICKNRHKCGDGTCVSPHHVCDGIWHCKDKSDEMDCPSGCGGPAFISGPSSGIIQSKNYPLSHNGNGDCEWQFVVSKHSSEVDTPEMYFEFTDFKTNVHDIMFLFKGAGVRKSGENLLGVYMGDRGSFNITIQANSATLLVRSNDFIRSRRFKMKYTLNNMT